ncbi:hypothetical protein PP1Y_AT4866 [Novosphingobium sp. PP1Y]|nr:hypothetical protein PP1Y_AT4866 [Novosphingobium sp. PP1Y]
MDAAADWIIAANASASARYGQRKREIRKEGDGRGPLPHSAGLVQSSGGHPVRMALCKTIRLFGGFSHDVYGDVLAALLAIVEAHATFGSGEQGVILADAHVHARVHLGAALTHDDVAADHFLTAELLHAEAATR